MEAINRVAEELQRQLATKVDYIVDTSKIGYGQVNQEGPPLMVIDGDDGGTFHITPHMHTQVYSHLGIPAKYYRKMEEHAPGLLCQNVNTWLWGEPEKRMVRTLDGSARAYVSDGFKVVDHWDLMKAVLPSLQTRDDILVHDAQVTDRKLYIKCFFEDLNEVVPGVMHQDPSTGAQVNEVVRAGFQVRNSEIGLGGYEVIPMVMVLWCINGQTINKASVKGRHFGARREEGIVRYADDTKRAELQAIQLMVRDTIEACADPVKFQRFVGEYALAAENRIEGDIIKSVEVVKETLSFTEDEGSLILRHLIDGGNLSQWGMAQAVTRTAQDVDDYDRSCEMEDLGQRVIDLPESQWRAIATA